MEETKCVSYRMMMPNGILLNTCDNSLPVIDNPSQNELILPKETGISTHLFSDRFSYAKRLVEAKGIPQASQDRLEEQQASPLSFTSPTFNLPSSPTSIYSSPSPPTSNVKVNRRKSSVPHKSPARFDPNFRGVVLGFHMKLVNNESQLTIETLSKNFKEKQLHRKEKTVNHSDTLSGSEMENSPKSISEPIHTESCEHHIKVCESCKTKKTPLWREAEDGTPLCNACGIRYKKYRIRCSECWHVPKKDDKTYPKCLRCDSMLRFTTNRRN
ncbi:GATA-type zinc finger protein 1 [Octopus bimaculoides]|uniref:GATA-type domain-containing protein n=1 Tax=Octopus bimaculoides TaxID=37653 RepID=A0A0L8HQS3_OCTBM|nr:GATA-type zinc finger protein 1 [Octopus bimaculoides]|eukprot:XP_014770617.1 PREDICTED: GATA-type zinc finger protein 1-like [Octopus bimaculoides]